MVQTGTPRSLRDWSDDELAEQLRAKAANVQFSYNDILNEMNRRSADRQADANLRASTTLMWATIAYAVLTAILVLVTWLD